MPDNQPLLFHDGSVRYLRYQDKFYIWRVGKGFSGLTADAEVPDISLFHPPHPLNLEKMVEQLREQGLVD